MNWLPTSPASRPQKVQNSAAKLVFKTRKRGHVQPLHWLQVQARIEYSQLPIKASSLTHLLKIFIYRLFALFSLSRAFWVLAWAMRDEAGCGTRLDAGRGWMLDEAGMRDDL